MNTPTPQETVAKLRQSFRRWQVLGWTFGILLALSGVGVAVYPSLWFGSARTEGTVIKVEPAIELIPHGDPHAGDIPWFEEVMVYYPVVEYQADGRKFTYRPRSTFRSYSVGQKVPVLYKVDRPGVARIDTFAERWLAPLMVGGVSLVLGVVIMVGAALSKRMFRQFEAALTEGAGAPAVRPG
jgi:hypothetical protein